MRLIHGKTRQKLFSQNSSMELRVRLIHGCVLYTEKYGNIKIELEYTNEIKYKLNKLEVAMDMEELYEMNYIRRNSSVVKQTDQETSTPFSAAHIIWTESPEMKN